ncbi:MAG: DUF4153 domain-containing protein [Clostridia bacterium]|nr:DUF4153 domain-containing protein [Clostridia bacterium]
MEAKANTFGRFLKTLAAGMLRFIVPFILTVRAAVFLYLFIRWDSGTTSTYSLFGYTRTFNDELLLSLGIGGYVGAAAAALVQLWGEKRLRPRVLVPLAVAVGLIANGLTTPVLLSESVLKDFSPYLVVGAILACILWGMAIVSRRGRDGAGVRAAILGAVIGVAVGTVLFAAFSVFLAAIDALLLDVDSDLYLLFALLGYGSVGITVFLSFLPKPDGEPNRNKAYSVAFGYILLPLYLVLLAILYAYLAVLLVRFKLPSGQLNPFGLVALMGFLILWAALKDEDARLACWYTRWGGLLLLPVTCVQALALWIRIDAYGLTPLRVISVAAVVLGLIAIGLCTFRARLSAVFSAAAVLVMLLTLTPANPQLLSNLSQEHRLKPLLMQYGMLTEQNEVRLPHERLPEEDYDKIKEGLSYFRYADCQLTPFGKAMADSVYHDFFRDYREQFGDGQTETYLYFTADYDKLPVSIAPYSELYAYHPEDPYRHDLSEPFVWTDPKSGETLTFSLAEPLRTLYDVQNINAREDITGEPILVPIDETHTLVILQCSLTVTPDEGSAVCWQLDGLLLVK